MILKNYKKIFLITIIISCICIAFTQSSCGIYRFKDVSIPDSVKLVKINQFMNKASYVSPTLGPNLTEKLKQKIVRQTKIGQTNGDNADWIINCTITKYGFTTSGISNQQVNSNRLTVDVHIEVQDAKTQKIINKYDVSSPFDYSGSLSLQQAEKELETQMMRDIPDAIFNRLFSNW